MEAAAKNGWLFGVGNAALIFQRKHTVCAQVVHVLCHPGDWYLWPLTKVNKEAAKGASPYLSDAH